MRDTLQDLVQQGHKTSARLDKLEEELAMKSASSGHSGDLAFHESKFHGRGVGSVGAEDREGESHFGSSFWLKKLLKPPASPSVPRAAGLPWTWEPGLPCLPR